MLQIQIRNEEVVALKQLPDAGRYADQLLTADVLRQEFEGGVIRRKSFCEALDIGESTLSTWLQAGRIPRVAAVAYVLWLALKNLGDEIQQRSELATDFYVIRSGDGYAVVQPADAATPDAIGHVIGSFDTIEFARKTAVAHSPRFCKVLGRAASALRQYEEEQFEDHGEDNWIAQCASALERARNFKIGPATLDEL